MTRHMLFPRSQGMASQHQDITITKNSETKGRQIAKKKNRQPSQSKPKMRKWQPPQEMPVTCEEPIPTKENNPGKGKKKAVKASVMWSPQQKETRRRRPTERYGMQIGDQEKNMKKESKTKNT